ncbi:MAG: RNA 3'-phosphate cyclase [Candidatus Heimdallarchaeota archaeon]|nr:MAG: RNA 3'-phosphate cyclase [Candidatus Heimdallarchaeota archaeon]
MQVYDGSLGEGGGSILRLVTSLALVTQEPVKIVNIRKNRPKPGLQTQHLVGVRALANFCGGELEGDYLRSKTISFTPANSWRSHLKIHVSTAGSLGLILQSLQLAILGIKNHTLKVEFQGGATFGKWAPSIPYINHVTWEIFRQMNFELTLNINRHGFYPKGGARVSAIMRSPSCPKGLNLDIFQRPELVNTLSIASKHLQKARVAERQAKTIASVLLKQNIESKIKSEYVNANNPGSGVLIYSRMGNSILSGDFVGERKLSAEKVGLKAYERYIVSLNSQSTVDPFLADQVLPIMATACNPSVFYTSYLSNHTKTNIGLIQEILGVVIHTEKINNRFKVSVDV